MNCNKHCRFFLLIKMDQEYCTGLYNNYFSMMEEPIFCRGWEKEVLHPDVIDENSLREWFVYFHQLYRNSFRSRNWDQDIVCVINDIKTLALTDNDFLPDYENKTVDDLDYLLRYAPVVKCDLKSLVIEKEGYDPAVLWYKDRNWPSAILYYMLSNRLLNNLDGVFVQSIILGYGYTSTILYELNNSYIMTTKIFHDFWKNNIENFILDYYNKTSVLLTNEDSYMIAGMLVENNYTYFRDNISLEDLKHMYNLFYTDYVNLTNTSGFTMEDFNREKAVIDNFLYLIRQNNSLMLFARANNSYHVIAQEAQLLNSLDA